MELELKKIQPNSLNPRASFSKEGLDELAHSIRHFGLLEPIIVRKKDDHFEVVVGERRYRASHQAGLDKVPVIIKQMSDREVIEFNLIENIKRENLTDPEKGKCCVELMEKYPKDNPTIRAMAQKLGFSEITIQRWISAYRQISPEVQAYMAPADESGRTPKGKIASREAYIISKKVKEPKKQLEVVKEVAKRRLRRDEVIKITEKITERPERKIDEIIQEISEEPAEVVFRLSHMQPILNGVKTQTSRKSLDPKIKEGAILKANLWQPDFSRLKVLKVERKKLGDFTEEDAKREGGYTLQQFQNVWKDLHGDWNPNESVNIIHFQVHEKK